MLLAVFSDSHGDTARMCAAITAQKPDGVVFLGDVVRDAEFVRARFPALPFYIVRGNCDGLLPGYEDCKLLELAGARIFAVHGHAHGVKFGLDRLWNSTWCAGAALGLYGHTHAPLWQERRGVQLMNPGSIGDKLHPTYGLANIENGRVSCRILDAPMGGASKEGTT